MKLEDALAISAAYPHGVEVRPRPTREQQEMIAEARNVVRRHAHGVFVTEAAEQASPRPSPSPHLQWQDGGWRKQ